MKKGTSRRSSNQSSGNPLKMAKPLADAVYEGLVAAFPGDLFRRVLATFKNDHPQRAVRDVGMSIVHQVSATVDGMVEPSCKIVYALHDSDEVTLDEQVRILAADKAAEHAEYAILSSARFAKLLRPLQIQNDVIITSPNILLVLVTLLRAEALRRAEEVARWRKAVPLGRPLKQPTAGERISLGLKVTADIKARLDSAAKMSGRTQSQEAEKRLEQTFEREDLLQQVLTLAYGPETAGVLMMLGPVMNHTGSWVNWMQSYEQRIVTDGSWTTNGAALWAAVRAGVRLLDATSAAIQSTFGDGTPVSNERYDAFGMYVADMMICAVRGDDDQAPESLYGPGENPPFGPAGQRAGVLLGRLARALRGSEPPF